MRFLLLLFIVVPISEMWLLIEIGSRYGALFTVGMVFLTAAIGLALLRQQGVSTLMRVNEKMGQGQIPAEEILGGVMLAVGGALLLTPGFITDAIGFACLIPASRTLMVETLIRQGVMMSMYGKSGQAFDHNNASGPLFEDGVVGETGKNHTNASNSSTIIDGEFRRED